MSNASTRANGGKVGVRRCLVTIRVTTGHQPSSRCEGANHGLKWELPSSWRKSWEVLVEFGPISSLQSMVHI